MAWLNPLAWPPVWLAVALASAWAADRLVGLDLFGAAGLWTGRGLVVLGLALMLWAAVTMQAARTTVIPGRQPAALVTSGPFRLSRNPIYLGDLLVLAGMILIWDAPVALPLVPVLGAILAQRFIGPEEDRLRAAFGPAFDAWAGRVRRWL